MDDPADRRDQIPRIVEPSVGIVDDATFLILGNLVAVDAPCKRSPPVD